VNTGFDGPYGNSKTIRDVLVFVTLEIEHKASLSSKGNKAMALLRSSMTILDSAWLGIRWLGWLI
jgi:hypothetical protein